MSPLHQTPLGVRGRETVGGAMIALSKTEIVLDQPSSGIGGVGESMSSLLFDQVVLK